MESTAVKARRILATLLLVIATTISAAAETPARLTDQEFWKLVSIIPNRRDLPFREPRLERTAVQTVIPRLTQTVAPGRAYSAWDRSRTLPISPPFGRRLHSSWISVAGIWICI